MLDFDLADMYAVETRALKQAVKRNTKRFPSDFMFKLNAKEIETMVSQNVIPSKSYLGGALPFVFTEQGVAMLSSVLNSETAVQVNIQIIRVFTRMRELLSSNKDILLKLTQIEKKLLKHDHLHKKNEMELQAVFEALKQLLNPESEKRNRVGYRLANEKD